MKSFGFLTLFIILFLFFNCENNNKNVQQTIDTGAIDGDNNAIKIENSTGIISLSEEYSEQDTIKIYNEDGTLWYKFSYFYDDSDGQYDFYNKNFSPFAFHPDYFVLALKVSGIEKNRYEVIVNENTKLKKFVAKDEPFLEYENWKDYVLSVYAVRFDAERNPLRSEANNQGTQIPFLPDIFYRPNQINGNWLQVTWQEKDQSKYAWIKWKDKNSLLIEIFHLD